MQERESRTRRRRRATAALAILGTAALAAGAAAGAGGDEIAARPAQPAAPPSLTRLVGARIVTPMGGTSPSRALLDRIAAGHVAGVILFARNIAGPHQVRTAIRRLQAAARAGHTAPLLILVDQEGGPVRRFPSLPPGKAPRRMTTTASAAAQGEATARALKARGVTVDLAPVADQTRDRASFLYERSFPGTAKQSAARACAFARALERNGVIATLKHFPGLGTARDTTDATAVSVPGTTASLTRRAGAYATCASPSTLTMVASASYPQALGAPGPAVIRPETYQLLRSLGAKGPTITDDLETPALAATAHAATKAVRAGADLLLYAQTEAAAARAHQELLAAARAGRLDRLALIAAAERLQALRSPT